MDTSLDGRIKQIELTLTKLTRTTTKLAKQAAYLTREIETTQTHLANAATQYQLLRLELGTEPASKAQ